MCMSAGCSYSAESLGLPACSSRRTSRPFSGHCLRQHSLCSSASCCSGIQPKGSHHGGTCRAELSQDGGERHSLTATVKVFEWGRCRRASPGLRRGSLGVSGAKETDMPKLPFSISRSWLTPFLLMVSIGCGAQVPVPEPVTDQETELGQEMYKELTNKGEIIESSPLYDTLKPIADSISRVAQSRYSHPFKFYLVHETQPNAFATPGGNVYVVDSLLYFVKNTEQLAGTLCHEVSHTIHRDGVELMAKSNRIKRHEIEAAILLGPTRAHIIAIVLLGKL